MKKHYLLAIVLALISTGAIAGNDNANPCGNHGNNCGQGDTTATGGQANAFGGNAYAGAAAGAISGSSVGDVTATGGRGGDGGNALSISEGGKGGNAYASGGDAKQGQLQGQSQRTDVNTSAELTQSATALNAGNSQQVGGQSTSIKFEDVANAPPVFLGNVSATMSCAGGFNAGGSSQDGSGAFGFTWVSSDCRSVVSADKFRELGMVDTACKILKTTKGFQRAAKRDPSLNDIDCSTRK